MRKVSEMPLIGFDPEKDYLFDPQQQKPFGICCICGREIYRPFQETCDRCLMDMEEDI
jgi:hypothetical protein